MCCGVKLCAFGLHSIPCVLCACPCFSPPPPSFLFVIEHMMPLCMVISWVYSVAMMIQHIVAEKEHRLKEVRPPECMSVTASV